MLVPREAQQVIITRERAAFHPRHVHVVLPDQAGMATSTSTAAANQEVQELKELFSRQPSTKALSLGYHPNVTCDRSMQCPIVGMRYKQKGRNYDLCEEEFGRLTPQEKSLFEQIMPPVYADDEEHIKRIVAENAPTNETLVDALVKQDRLKTQSYIQAFRSCDRGYFLPAGLAAHSIYADRPLKLPEPSEVHQSAPHMYATVIELMQFKPGHSFLNIGSGTGYLSALSGCFTGAEGINHGIEISASNVSLAKDSVRRFFADRQTFVPVKFCCANAFRLDVYRNIRYDRIYVGAACQQRGYEYLREAIKVGGFMVVPGEDGEFKDKLVRIKRIDELTFETESLMGVRFAPMQACPTELPDASEKEMLVIEHREDAADRMNRDVISATPTADPDDVKTPTSNLLIDVSAPVQEENRPDAGLGGSGKALTLTAKLGGSMKSLGRGLKKVKSKSKHELEEVHRRTEAAGNVVVAHGQKQSSQSDDALPHDVMISLNVRTMGDLGMRLKRFLAQRGIGAWVCVDNLGAGAGFRREILRAIQNCKCFLALINNEWAESAECEIESNLALNLNLHSHEQGRSVRGQPRVPFLLPVSFPGLDWSQETVQWFAVGTNFLSFDGDDESALFDRIHDSIVSCGLGIGSSVAPVRRTPQSSALSKTKLSAPIAQLQESSFYFVSSDKLKESSEQVLPSMQELRQREGWLVRMEFDPLEACQGAYNEEYLCVSHRWEEKDQPDSQGIQTQAIKDYLRRNPQYACSVSNALLNACANLAGHPHILDSRARQDQVCVVRLLVLPPRRKVRRRQGSIRIHAGTRQQAVLGMLSPHHP